MYLTNEQLEILFHEVCAVIEGQELAFEEDENMDIRRLQQLRLVKSKIGDEQYRRSIRKIEIKLDNQIGKALTIAGQVDSKTRSQIITSIENAVLETEDMVGQKFSKWDRFRPTKKQLSGGGK